MEAEIHENPDMLIRQRFHDDADFERFMQHVDEHRDLYAHEQQESCLKIGK